jgi:hypothetical protein
LPYVRLVELHTGVPEQVQKLLLKRDAPVMLFLALDVSNHVSPS